MKKKLTVVISFILLICCLVLTSCKDKTADNIDQYMSRKYYNTLYSDMGVDFSKNVNVKINIQDYGTISLELYPDIAPITVRNFVYLAKQGFYNGLNFHRVISGFMIQGGSTDGIGIKGSDENIKGEFSQNGVQNTLSHKRGVISMARSGNSNDSASSQFFICHADSTFLDGSYASFGMVTDGFDVLDSIANCDCEYICSRCGNIFDNSTGICTNPDCDVYKSYYQNGKDYSSTYCAKSYPKQKIIITSIEICK